MANQTNRGGVPAVAGAEDKRPALFETITNDQHYDYDGSEDADFAREPPIEIVINPSELKEKILDYLGAVLARCWIERSLLGEIERDAHRTLRHLGILLPPEIEIKVERPGRDRPRLVIYEWDENRRFKRRICYLQLIMMAGK
ncbi:MAG: hypothetical protein RLZ07_763 [Pseudomonadota bacterium]|jgi:hypothetical protein